MRKLTLDKLKKNESGVIFMINLNGKIRYRLLEMGFVPGCTITMVRRAPLGNPIQFEIMGYWICLREEIARDIVVEVMK